MKQCKRCKKQLDPSHKLVRCDECADHVKKIQLRRQYIYKAWVYAKLGGKCVSCGTQDYRVLTIDHVNRDAINDSLCWTGNQTRDSRWYLKIYKYLQQSGDYPKQLQLLCMNCHMVKDFYDSKSFQQYCEDRIYPLKMEDFNNGA